MYVREWLSAVKAALVLALISLGMAGCDVLDAQVLTVRPESPSVSIAAGAYRYVDYIFTNSGTNDIYVPTRSAVFRTESGYPLSGIIGPYGNSIEVPAGETVTWTDYVYMPPDVAETATMLGRNRVTLHQSFQGSCEDGASVESTALLSVTFSPEVVGARVHFVYLVPSDRPESPGYASAIEDAANAVRSWFDKEVGETFELAAPVVATVRTNHPADWYSEGCTENDCFWRRVAEDAQALTEFEYMDPEARWVFYIDAEPSCGQIEGAALQGIVILPRHDLLGVSGESPIEYPCGNVEVRGIERWRGGLAHEIGHAFGLPHPAGCEDDDPRTSCPSGTLMYTGYLDFPKTSLQKYEKELLSGSSFFR